MEKTPKSLRLHIGIYGRRNVGKSSLFNAIIGQDFSIVSPHKGTTTDPVEKAMEIPPLGPVLLIDTAGLDDTGDLGALRIKRSRASLDRVELALLVVDGEWGAYEEELCEEFKSRNLSYIVVCNKSDVIDYDFPWLSTLRAQGVSCVLTSASNKKSLDDLLQALISKAPADYLESLQILGDLLPEHGLALLVVPLDMEAPKGRIILPQVQTIRDLLDNRALCMVCKETELSQALSLLKDPPDIVVTDSQAFAAVSAIVPETVPLTGFSVLFARYKGDLQVLAKGASEIGRLKAGDRVLIAEACTHHPNTDDIGRAKIPRWLQKFVGGELKIEVSAGPNLPEDLSPYSLIIHCGACMFNRRLMLSRLQAAKAAGVAITNYGLTIAYLHGIFERALRPFPNVYSEIFDNK